MIYFVDVEVPILYLLLAIIINQWKESLCNFEMTA